MKNVLNTLAAVFLVLNTVLYPAHAQNAKQILKTLFEEGYVAYEKGQHKEAIDLFEQALKIKPDFAAVYNYLGLAHKGNGAGPQEVIDLFKKAIEYDPHYAHAYDNLAKAYYGIGDFDGAEQYGLKAVETDPDLITAHLSMGWIYLLGKSEAREAIPYFEKVVENDPVALAYFGLGVCYFMDNQRGNVLNSITALKQMDEENLAEQLENMMRSGKYTPPKIPRDVPTVKQKSTLVRNNVPDFPEYNSSENRPVRVRSRTSALPQKNPSSATQENYSSGAERIRALRGNSQLKGSGY